MFVDLRGLAFVILSVLAGAGARAQTSASTDIEPYLQSHLPGVELVSILTVDDRLVSDGAGGKIGLVGSPDGIGAIDGDELVPPDPDHFYLLVGHEISARRGRVRAHGSIGAFVSQWKINKTTLQVVEGQDLIQRFNAWDEHTETFFPTTTVFDRMCSADRPAASALHDASRGVGTTEIILLNGEETANGRAFAHIAAGPDAGSTYHLEHLGYGAFENVLANPFEQPLTLVALTEDTADGGVYFYIGQKRTAGNGVERAGLVGGRLYALAVDGKPYEMADDRTLAVSR